MASRTRALPGTRIASLVLTAIRLCLGRNLHLVMRSHTVLNASEICSPRSASSVPNPSLVSKYVIPCCYHCNPVGCRSQEANSLNFLGNKIIFFKKIFILF